jgi:hypothetical protein
VTSIRSSTATSPSRREPGTRLRRLCSIEVGAALLGLLVVAFEVVAFEVVSLERVAFEVVALEIVAFEAVVFVSVAFEVVPFEVVTFEVVALELLVVAGISGCIHDSSLCVWGNTSAILTSYLPKVKPLFRPV